MTTSLRDFVFGQGRIFGSPTNLVFGAAGDAVVKTPLNADALVTLAGAVEAVGQVAYDNRVTPYREAFALAKMQTALQQTTSLAAAWGVSAPQRGRVGIVSAQAMPAAAVVNAQTEIALNRLGITREQWQAADKAAAATAVVYQPGLERTAVRALPASTGVLQTKQLASPAQTGIEIVRKNIAGWQWAQGKVAQLAGRSGASTGTRSADAQTLRYATAISARGGRSVLPVVVRPTVVIYARDGKLVLECPPVARDLVFGEKACYAKVVLPAAAVVVLSQKVYIVINNASLRRVDGNIDIPVFSMSLSLDADSWAWSFSAAVPGSALSALEPSESGAPVEVEALVNGVAYRALVERVARERSFGKSDLRVSGRGKTALLDSPYAPAQIFGNTAARTAQQLAADVLTINNVPMGWSLDWQLDDWLVPAGVFSHAGSYISAINVIAAAAGGYVQPHATAQTLRVLPRYPVAPWNWGSVAPDFVLPSDVTVRESIEWIERARYNRVYVSGQQVGVLGQVTRAGTAGDLLAAAVTDPLITTASAARQRGLSVLANTGRQAEISLRLPVLAETGIITPGKYVRYTDAGVNRIGIVRSTGVEVGMPEIWQTLGVQTYA